MCDRKCLVASGRCFQKRRAFSFYHVSVVRDTGDPEYAGAFLLFAGAVAGADAYCDVGGDRQRARPSLAVNLSETIALTHELFELREAPQRAH
jgi:hypothetical protein